MRLSKEIKSFLKSEITHKRNDAEVYLFGSRTSVSKKGGDIDILIISSQKLNSMDVAELEMKFWAKFGEQKIDFVNFTPDSTNAFKRLIMETAIKI